MLCYCGCGQEVKKGNTFIHGHNMKSVRELNPSSPLCFCGCGEIVASKKRYVSGHNRFKLPYVHIPSICLCGCNETIWGNNEYRVGHTPKTKEWIQKQSVSMQGKPAWNKGYGDYIKGDKHPLWGKHHTTESKLKSSITNSGKRRSPLTEFKKGHEGRKGKDNPAYGKIPAKGSGWGKGTYYQSPLQGMVYLRSSYELAYAQYLDEKRVLWLYELETFNLGLLNYTPDFFLPIQEKFVEIKGWMKESDKKRIELFREQYPFDLELLNREDLLKLGLSVK